MVQGVKSEKVVNILKQIPLEKRISVQEISLDMSNSMDKIARESFPNARIVTDRFHVAQLVCDAVKK